MKLTVSKIVGILFASIHLVLFILFSLKMNFGYKDAMSGMLWGIWETVDFPVSLLAFYGFIPFPLNLTISAMLVFIYPYFIHGVVGTIWWYFLPIFSGKVLNKIFKRDVIQNVG